MIREEIGKILMKVKATIYFGNDEPAKVKRLVSGTTTGNRKVFGNWKSYSL